MVKLPKRFVDKTLPVNKHQLVAYTDPIDWLVKVRGSAPT